MDRLYFQCPSCPFNALVSDFIRNYSEDQRLQLKTRFNEFHRSSSMHLRSDLGGRLYYGALGQEILREVLNLELSPFERVDFYLKAFWWTSESNLLFLGEKVIEKLLAGLNSREISVRDQYLMKYLLGEISRRLGRQEDALRYFQQAMAQEDKTFEEAEFFVALTKKQMENPTDELSDT